MQYLAKDVSTALFNFPYKYKVQGNPSSLDTLSPLKMIDECFVDLPCTVLIANQTQNLRAGTVV